MKIPHKEIDKAATLSNTAGIIHEVTGVFNVVQPNTLEMVCSIYSEIYSKMSTAAKSVENKLAYKTSEGRSLNDSACKKWIELTKGVEPLKSTLPLMEFCSPEQAGDNTW